MVFFKRKGYETGKGLPGPQLWEAYAARVREMANAAAGRTVLGAAPAQSAGHAPVMGELQAVGASED